MQRPFPSYSGSDNFLFVSYAHADDDTVYPEIDWLNRHELNLWYDEGIHAGSVWRDELADRLGACDRIVFFATEASINSRNCLNELHFAMDLDKPVLVIQFDELELPPGLRFGLGSRQAIIASHYSQDGFRQAMLAALTDDESAPAPVAAKEEPSISTSLVIADFENNTDSPVFQGTLEGILSDCLKSVSDIEIFASDEARNVAMSILELDSLAELKLNTKTASLVGFREGIQFVLGGTISKTDTGYLLELLIIKTYSHPGEESEHRIEVKAGNQGMILAELTRSTSLIFDLINANYSAEALRDEESITTKSIDAAHYYVLGQRAQKSWEFEEAIANYKQAVKFDSEFGRAYAGLAAMYTNIGNNEEAAGYYRKSLANIERMNSRERYRTRGGYYLMLRNPSKAAEEYRQLLAEFPTDEAGLTNLALAYFYGRDLDKAIDSTDRGLAKLPDNKLLQVNKALYLMYAGDFQASNKLADELLEILPNAGELILCKAVNDILVEEDLDEAACKYSSLRGDRERNNFLSAAGLSDLEIHRGNLAGAEKVLQDSGLIDRFAILKILSAEVAILRGEPDAAKEILDSIEGSDFSVMFWQALAYLECDSKDAAQLIGNKLANRIERDNQAMGCIIKGAVDLSIGEPLSGLQQLEKSTELLDTWMARFFTGKCYLAMEAYIEAHSEFERCQRRTGEMTCMLLDEIPTIRMANKLLLNMALCQQGLGSSAASTTADKLLALWDTPQMQNSKSLSEAKAVAAT